MTDTGAGTSEQVINRALDFFFTTRAGSGGSGLGLANVKAIAREAKGDVRIGSKVGIGTTVTVLLPAFRDNGDPLALRGSLI